MKFGNRTKTFVRNIDESTGVDTASLVARFLGTLIVSILIPWVTGVLSTYSNKPEDVLTPINQYFLGVLVFLALSNAGVVWELAKLKQQHKQENKIGYIKDQFGTLLSNINTSYDELIRMRRISNDLYTAYFYRSLQQFEQRLYEAATKQELQVNELHFSTTDLLLSCFTGRPNDIIRLVHFLEDNSFMFDVWSQGYYRQIVKLVNESAVTEVRRLFVYKDAAELSTPESQRLLEFHARQPGYDYRVVPFSDFMKFCRDMRTNENGTDFGIYGDWYVYTTRSATADRIEGVFSSSEMVVKAYIDLFDRCWNHGMAHHPTSEPPMTLYELFEGQAPPSDLQDVVS